MPTRPTQELASATAKRLLREAMAAQNVRPVDLAERLGTTRQVVNRLIDLDHPTKIDAINDALAVLGKKLVLGIADL